LSWEGSVSRFWEAESGVLTYPMREVFLPAACSANFAIARAVRDPVWNPARGIARAEWTVSLPRRATYALWARLRAREGARTGMDVTVDGRPAGTLRAGGLAWTWVRLPDPLPLDAGRHAIQANMPEAGIELDKWLLTSDAGLAPRGMGNAPTDPPDQVTGLGATLDRTGEFILLKWAPCESRGFHHYQVYRGESADFELTQRALLGSPVRAAFIDPGPMRGAAAFYRVVAVDSWGNASAPTTAAPLRLPPRPEPVSVTAEMQDGKVSAGARILADPDAEGGKCVAFGKPDEVPEYAGEVAVPVDVPPGEYSVWLRVKGAKRKPVSFFWVQLGDSRHYSRTRVAAWTGRQAWVWRHVTFLKSVRDPQEHRMRYTVSKRPTVLTIRHRANYMAVDRAFITSLPYVAPSLEAGLVHPGCSKAFRR